MVTSPKIISWINYIIADLTHFRVLVNDFYCATEDQTTVTLLGELTTLRKPLSGLRGASPSSNRTPSATQYFPQASSYAQRVLQQLPKIYFYF